MGGLHTKKVFKTLGTFVDGSVRRIRKASSEIIPEQPRTKHATSEFHPTNQP